MHNPNARLSSFPKTALLVTASMVLVAIVTVGILYSAGILTLGTRQAEVAERGAQVMPFDLDQTTHVFERRADGGLQTVIAKDPANREQIALIQTHLQQETGKFRQGDFGDPAKIHGQDMPGLAELQAGARQIDVQYTALPNGAQIRYITTDQALVTALHHWFMAQVSDHGVHASEQ